MPNEGGFETRPYKNHHVVPLWALGLRRGLLIRDNLALAAQKCQPAVGRTSTTSGK